MEDYGPVMVAVPREWLSALRDLVERLASDLEAEIADRIPEKSRDAYPSERRRFDRDMCDVIAARGLEWPGLPRREE